MNIFEVDDFVVTKTCLERIGRDLGVIADIDDPEGFRPALLSMPSLHLTPDAQGVIEVSSTNIAEDCIDEINSLKILIVDMNSTLAQAGIDHEESRNYIERMRDFPIRSL